MKHLILLIISACIISSCSEPKTFKKNGKTIEVEPYGFLNSHKKVDGIVYEANVKDVVLSIVGFESILIPVLICGYDIMEPIDTIK